MRALMMVAVIGTHRVPEGFTSTPFHYQHRFAMPVTPNRSVSLGDDIETFEIPIEQGCNLNPCYAKQRTHNPVCITKTIVLAKKQLRLVRVMPYLLHKCCSQLSSGSCMENLASATSIVTVISAVATAWIRFESHAWSHAFPATKCIRRDRMGRRHS